MLVIRLLQGTAVLYQLLYNFPVHKRLTAKEIYFQVSAVSGIRYQEIQCFFADLKAHECTSAVILALFRKTVLAA